MKKTLLFSILCLSCVAMTAWSQNLMLNQEDPEDVIDVVGYFNKNDTMVYRHTYDKIIIKENDTTVSASVENEFMIVVTDSTSDGYKMKYIPLGIIINDEDTDSSLVTNTINQLMKSVEYEFTTDEFGLFKGLTNWGKIRGQLEKGIKSKCDSLYSTIHDLNDIVSREEMENILWIPFSTREGILEALFGLHGTSYKIGETEEDTEEDGYPQHNFFSVRYSPIEDEQNDFDGDYEFITQSTTTIPVEEVMDLGLGLLSLIGSDMVNDNIEAVRDQIVDSLKIAKPNGAEIIEKEVNSFFFNGWPKEVYTENVVDMGLSKTIEYDCTEWIYRRMLTLVDKPTEN